jgi:hypothetical protein
MGYKIGPKGIENVCVCARNYDAWKNKFDKKLWFQTQIRKYILHSSLCEN